VVSTASQYFVHSVQIQYQLAIEQVRHRKVIRHHLNWYTDHAPPAYVMAVAALEAFLNEIAFAPMTKMMLPAAPLWQFDSDWLEKLELRRKLMLVPHLLFGKILEPGAQPLQDMFVLIKVRNDFVHYKLTSGPRQYMAELDRKGVSLHSPDPAADYVWPQHMCASEGIRWANNTMCATARALVALIPDEHRSQIGSLVDNFLAIDAEVPRACLSDMGRNPDGNEP
jgi:hypothetical protein